MSVVLSDHLPLISTSPAGIQKLRSLILELAVRGKLLPQDPKDEPANELLMRIAQERARLEAEGICRRSRPMPAVEKDEQRFDLPTGWAWIRLGQIGDWGAGATPLRSNPRYYGGSIPWFKSGELIADFIADSEEYVTELALKECSLRQNRTGDVLIAMYGATIGKTAILARPATTNQAVCACTPNTGVSNRFLLTLLKALKPHFIGQGAGGAQPNISREKIVATVIALPPEAEQHRIVAKVDELMVLCDQLEAQQVEAEAANTRLVKTLLGTLTHSTSAADLASNWQRFAAHFDILFTSESSLDALKQAILQLAIMGKLVPQDPDDESADELFKRIAEERTRLEETGGCKKAKTMPSVAEDQQLFTLPAGWKWVRLGELSELITSGSRDWAKHYSTDGAIFVRMGNLSRGSYQLRLSNIQHVTPPSDGEGTRTRLQPGDLLLSITGEVGLLGLIPDGFGEAYINQHTCMIRTFSIIRGRFIPEVLRSPLALVQYNEPQRGIKNSFRLTDVAEMIVPLPPLAEQHRIVNKIDELMSLCEHLKTDLAESRNRQARLASILIETALKAA